MEENVNGNQPISIVDPEAHSMLYKHKPDKKEKFRKHKFIKDWENDTYTCPNGSILTRQNNNM